MTIMEHLHRRWMRMSNSPGPLQLRLVRMVMRVALQHQGMPLRPVITGSLSLKRLQGLSNNTVSSKIARAHPLPSSRKVHSLVSTNCRNIQVQHFALPGASRNGKSHRPWELGVMLVLY